MNEMRDVLGGQIHGAPARDSQRRFDSNGLEILTEGECLDYLARCTLGRIGYVVDDRVRIIPLNYALDGHALVFHAGPGSTRLIAALGEHVAFEVDSADRETRTAWSVVASGPAWEVHDSATVARFRQLPIRAWIPVSRPHWIRIQIEELHGRRVPA